MAQYVKITYPQGIVGVPQTRPPLPDYVTKISEYNVTWDIFSANEDDRSEYWEIDTVKYNNAPPNPYPLLSAAQVELAVYGANGKAAWIAANPEPEL